MIIYTLILATQIAGGAGRDSLHSSPALEKLVAVVSQANRRVPPELQGYTARIESEVALLASSPSNQVDAAAAATQTAAEIEQVQSLGVWDRSGRFEQTVVGYRARQLSPIVSALTIIPRPWTAPTLYGNRLALIFGGPPSFRNSDSTREEMAAVHPFAEDRDEYYRYSGGDTVASIHTGPNILRIVSIHVEPLQQRRRAMLFAGDVLVDAGSGAIIRMRGRIALLTPEHETLVTRVIRRVANVQGVAYVDFENSLYEGRFWLPQHQLLEYQVTTGLSESKATVRVESDWRDVKLTMRDTGSVVASDTLGPARYSLRFAPQDSMAKWNDWERQLGAMTAGASVAEFADVAPPETRPGDAPRLRWQARSFSDLLRFNRVEGLYVGESALLDFGRRSPGLSIRMSGGLATFAKTAKGGVEATDLRGPWILSATAERQLVSTNDFSQMFRAESGNPVASLFGQEDYDWVDRYTYGVGATRELGQTHASSITVQLAEQHDQGFAHELSRGPFGGTFRPNRPVTRGRYVSSRLQLELGRNVVSDPLVSGLGAAMSYTRGDGDLSWQRAQLQTLGRKMFGRLELAARLDEAVVSGSHLPVQQLLEVGGTEGLPGYDYKAFSGDQATIVRSTVTYMLPMLESPMRFGKVILPAISPRVQVGLSGGRTSASATTARQLDELGWVTSDGWRGSLDFRLLFVGGAVSVGVSRPIDRQQGWKMQLRLGGER